MAATPHPLPSLAPALGISLPYPQCHPDEQTNPVQTRFDKTPPSLHRAPGGQTAIRLNKSQVE